MGARAPPVAIEKGIGVPLEARVMLSAGTGCPTVQEKLRVMPSATVSFGAGLPTVSRMGRAKSPYPEFCTRSVALYEPWALASATLVVLKRSVLGALPLNASTVSQEGRLAASTANETGPGPVEVNATSTKAGVAEPFV